MIRLLSFSLAMFAATFAGNLFAQELPGTDIWLARITNGLPVEPVKINTGIGYNNQPHFSEDGSVIYYTREMSDGKAAQTDISAFNTKTTITTMVNNTPESEYSPTPIPDRNALSVIQVEADQKQRLWAIDVASGNMDLLLADVEPVGYHAWINDSEVAMFILGDSFTLQIASLDNKDASLVADNIGRSIRKHPQTGEILFVDKNREPWQIAAFDPITKQVRGVMPLFPANEDFTIDANGNYWSGNGSKLYKRPAGDSRWELMADFKTFGINHISRLAINLNSGQIALVSNHAITN
jgi:Tol biopolymer transport system component